MEKDGSHTSDCKNYHIGIDVGTGSVRALVIDEYGRSIASSVEKIAEWQPRRSIHIQSTSEIWSQVCRAVKKALRQGEVLGESIHSIAFVATCSLALFTHDTGEPVAADGESETVDSTCNIILWKDSRAGLETDSINNTQHELLKYLGGSVSILMELPKIPWLKHHMSEASFRRCKFYDLHDALTFIATRSHTIPCTEACERQMLPVGVDGTAKGWSREFLQTIGLAELADDEFQMVGGVCRHGQAPPAGSLAGHLCPDAARDLGLSTSVGVGIETIDAYSGWIGTVGMTFDGDALLPPLQSRMAIVAGTSACYIVASQRAIFVDGAWGPYQDWVIPGFWMSEGGQVATGMLLQHIIEVHPACAEAKKISASLDITIFEYLDKHLEQMRLTNQAADVAYIARHYFFYGDLYGNRSPISDASMTGSVVGLSADTSIDNLALQYYGALEFIAFQIRQVISKMNEAGMEITTLFMSGPVVQNAGLVRLIATCCNMPVVIPKKASISVSFGAALLAVRANTKKAPGCQDDLWSIMQRLGQIGDLRQPVQNTFVRDLLDIKYSIYLELCERQRVFRHMVDQAIADHKGFGRF